MKKALLVVAGVLILFVGMIVVVRVEGKQSKEKDKIEAKAEKKANKKKKKIKLDKSPNNTVPVGVYGTYYVKERVFKGDTNKAINLLIAENQAYARNVAEMQKQITAMFAVIGEKQVRIEQLLKGVK